MFGKLKSKLKNTLSIFSKKAEEEAIEAEIEVEKELIEEQKVVEKKEKEEEVVLKEIDNVLADVDETKKIVEEEKTSKVSAEELLASAHEVEETKDVEVAPEPSKHELLDLEADETVIDSEELKVAEEKEVEKILEVEKQKEIKVDKTVETVTKEPSETKKEEVIKEEPKEKKSFFSKIKQKLTTKTINQEKFEELFWDLEVLLLESNVSVKVIERIKSDLSKELVDKPLPRDVAGKIQEVLAHTLKEILSIERKDIIDDIKKFKKEGKPYTIIFFGINGSGKTTTIAKLGHYLKEQGITTVMAAGDTFRAAAIDQLQDHATKLGIKLIKHDYGSDAAAVAYDAKKYAEKNNIDVVLIDTAGRLHSNTNLMAELEKMMRVANPDCKIFIGESITGNDCVEQAEKYESTLGIDGIILTKADVDEMGGAPLSICYVTGKPILFLGMGQEYSDLVPFTADLILEKLGISE